MFGPLGRFVVDGCVSSSSKLKKILVIGHAYIAPINRKKWLIVSKKYSNLKIKVLIPENWPSELINHEIDDLSKYNSKNCEFISLDGFNFGNEVLYGFNFFELIKILKNFKPDLIHVEQGDNAFSYFQINFLSKLFCRKAKFIFFTWINWRFEKSLKYKFFWNWLEKFNLYFSDGAIVGNKDAKIILKEKKFLKPILNLLQLGIDEQIFKPVCDVHEDYKTIGFIGRIIKEKGVFILIDAFYKINKIFPEWKLFFVGDGKDKQDLLNYISEKKLENYVEFISVMSHEKVAQVLKKFEIFVLPSYDTNLWREQFGHVLIESMACKIPVIGSSAGEIPNVIKNAGLIFEQKNSNQLFECLKKLIENKKLRKQLGEMGYQRFKSNYSYEVIADKTYKFWSSFI